MLKFTDRETAEQVAKTLTQETGRPWNVHRWTNNEFMVDKETLESDIVWLAANVGDMHDWVKIALEAWFEHTNDTLCDLEIGESASDWRNADIQSIGVDMVATSGEFAKLTVKVGGGLNERSFNITITRK